MMWKQALQSTIACVLLLWLPGDGESQEQSPGTQVTVTVVKVDVIDHPDPQRSAVAQAILSPDQPHNLVLISSDTSADDLARALTQVLTMRKDRPGDVTRRLMVPVVPSTARTVVPEWHRSRAQGLLDLIDGGAELDFSEHGTDPPPQVRGIMPAAHYNASFRSWLPRNSPTGRQGPA